MKPTPNYFDIDMNQVRRNAEQLRSNTLREFVADLRKRWTTHG